MSVKGAIQTLKMVSGLLQGDAGEITAKFGLVMGLTAEAACRSALSRASSGEGAEAEPLAACSRFGSKYGWTNSSSSAWAAKAAGT